jgi:outer membrane protein OmpA-like peptidoglycan-associated protein
MKLVSQLVLVAAGVLLGVAGAAAESSDVRYERLFEFSPWAGAFLPDENTDYGSGSPLVGLRAALNASERWTLEGALAISPGQSQTIRTGMLNSYKFHIAFNNAGQPTGIVYTELDVTESSRETSTTLFLGGGNVLIYLASEGVRPFLTMGAGFIEDLSRGEDASPSPFSNLYGTFGVGLKFERKSFGLRVEVKDYLMRRDDLPQGNDRAALLAADRDIITDGGDDGIVGQEPFNPDSYRGQRWLNNYGLEVSVTFPFGFAWQDGDGDMIEDRFDESLTTAPGVIVDPLGRCLDTDEDGVFDGLDQCAGTPLGATVDLQGCPSDTDGDGIFDGIDQCADTPVGALVSALGCPSDTDGDGVLDGLDNCNDTPLGAAIDDKGCVKDPVEADLLRRQLILVENVEFEPGREELRPLSYHYVNKVGRLLERWTGHEENPLRIEIGVHTDGTGEATFNMDLSQRRAERVRKYLLENFYKMGQNNLVAQGYGESLPIADDATVEGRAANRRVEIRVIGDGDVPEAYEVEIGDDDFLNLDDLLPGLDLPDLEMPDLEMPDIPEEPALPDLE